MFIVCVCVFACVFQLLPATEVMTGLLKMNQFCLNVLAYPIFWLSSVINPWLKWIEVWNQLYKHFSTTI